MARSPFVTRALAASIAALSLHGLIGSPVPAGAVTVAAQPPPLANVQVQLVGPTRVVALEQFNLRVTNPNPVGLVTEFQFRAINAGAFTSELGSPVVPPGDVRMTCPMTFTAAQVSGCAVTIPPSSTVVLPFGRFSNSGVLVFPIGPLAPTPKDPAAGARGKDKTSSEGPTVTVTFTTSVGVGRVTGR